MHRLRQSRGKLVERLRGAESGEATAHEARGNEFIDDLMKEEFKQIKRLEMSPNIFCDCCSDKVCLAGNSNSVISNSCE